MKINTWIEKTGPKKVAVLLGVDPSTVSQWRNFINLPRPKQMVKINKLTKGRVSYKEMVEPVAKNQK